MVRRRTGTCLRHPDSQPIGATRMVNHLATPFAAQGVPPIQNAAGSRIYVYQITTDTPWT